MKELLVFTALGKVSEFLGKAGKIGYKVGNLLREDKRVQLHLLSDDNLTQVKAFLSPELSKQLRNRTLTLGNIKTFDWSLDSNGFRTIHRPEETILWVDSKDLKESKTTEVKVNHQDIIAF